MWDSQIANLAMVIYGDMKTTWNRLFSILKYYFNIRIKEMEKTTKHPSG
jgi:hypothetical protein